MIARDEVALAAAEYASIEFSTLAQWRFDVDQLAAHLLADAAIAAVIDEAARLAKSVRSAGYAVGEWLGSGASLTRSLAEVQS